MGRWAGGKVGSWEGGRLGGWVAGGVTGWVAGGMEGWVGKDAWGRMRGGEEQRGDREAKVGGDGSGGAMGAKVVCTCEQNWLIS